MSDKSINRLQPNLDDLQDIGKHMYAIANGNYILQYTAKEYRDYLTESPSEIIQLLVIYHASSNWGYDDPRMFENYDEQWLAEKVDSNSQSSLDYNLPDFNYNNLLPYQKVVIDFTQRLITEANDFSNLLHQATNLERIYAVLANNIRVDSESNEILNKEATLDRAIEMYYNIVLKNYKISKPFEAWELRIN
ncbi:MAG: hypothetical protein GQ574_08620 [Crocinitomix sp.]|nr:hypothetical protein [Crocinitomix sp.]